MSIKKKFKKWLRLRQMSKEMARAVTNGDLVISGFIVSGMEMIDMQNVRVFNCTFDTATKRPHLILTKKVRKQSAAVVIKGKDKS